MTVVTNLGITVSVLVVIYGCCHWQTTHQNQAMSGFSHCQVVQPSLSLTRLLVVVQPTGCGFKPQICSAPNKIIYFFYFNVYLLLFYDYYLVSLQGIKILMYGGK